MSDALLTYSLIMLSLEQATNAVSHFVSLCRKAFSSVHNMTPIFRPGDVLDTLSSM